MSEFIERERPPGQERARQVLGKLPTGERERALAGLDRWEAMTLEDQVEWRAQIAAAFPTDRGGER